MKNLPQISQFQNAKVLVVGDVMLDRYWFGDVSRISPEAPVPIAKIGKTEHRAGGAANVARNIAALGGQVALLSVSGDDEAADTLADLLAQDGIANHILRSQHAPTTVKLRVLSRNQQLIRLDFEENPDSGSLNDVLQQFGKLVGQYDVVILSDYGKGVLNHVAVMIATARAIGKPVLIDPKGSDYDKYANATLLTPNRAELREAVGSWYSENSLTRKAQQLRENLGLEALLLTRSEEGMSLYRENQIDHQATRAQEVYDVSGAGDTVIGAMGLCLAAGFSLPESMHIANAAAGVVVAKLGTAVCGFDELTAALAQEQESTS
ncbi:D-glycero-beta-D-manno-heptose-7-phosphate kinase [Alysiella filiformis]|uniref:D-alpha,beta-D-heptose 7-phosphate 1-kinase n=1 Tax=Alysiella filiformis DSM 16848 TaxID=1120981 RepID=A0A286E870_9NEIS|nr:D-glycero-beta-D-manno-heptose-7-phosphate kinase [Alysiella filiformis]QMT32048.1 D-glycero-beta-D-manno-heptose-7-phosphate kinase [Alysiella filiformis]UBQ57043.1 D-glycero-beta-D-manno-heptose-7-phosphate kinase [Alysiella filiformis DSM 16848]SOD67083.1 D-alpha,beta-D-heptose 7-phosphate 1-kinase [Alysiella filiformis DSM 16848]